MDNDKGGKAVFSQVKEMLNLEEAVDGSQDFYRIKYNLYLVATPKVNKKETCIEDFFKDDALKEKVNGKTFSKENKYEKEKKYGKSVFAERVIIKKQKNIDFTGFKLILDRLNSAIEDYKSFPKKNIKP